MITRVLACACACAVTTMWSETGAQAATKKKPAPTAAQGKTAVQPKASRGAPTPKAPAELLMQAAEEITRQVASLRGLAVKKPLARGVLTREEIGSKLRDRIGKEYTAAEVRAEAMVLTSMGLLPAGTDYEKLILDILMEQVAGFYDPFAAKLYISDWLPLDMQRPALAHEIEHALQDQHFDLKRFATPIKDNGDKQLARSSLVEGDGTAIMIEFQARAMGLPTDKLPELVSALGSKMLEGGMASAPMFEKAPRFLRESLIFPYLEGLKFVESFRAKQPWSRVDEVWKNPPESTEQVLHPEKYAAKEAPIAIVPAMLTTLGAVKELRRDVLGEFVWRVWFSSLLGDEGASAAAAGWGGDRLVAYQEAGKPDAAPTVVILSAWDSDADAAEAETKLRALAGKLADAWVERKGMRNLLVIGSPATLERAKISEEVWRTWK